MIPDYRTDMGRGLFVRGSRRFILISLFLFLSASGFSRGADEPSRPVPNRYGMAISGGNSYSPENDISYVLLTAFGLFDYRKVWGHRAPEALRFKVEGTVGTTTRPDRKLMTSANMFALYYLKGLTSKAFRPYVEGGIGVIYTDFQVEGQGLRFNFNPQAGIGVEVGEETDRPFFFAVRLHHISNAGLDHDNKGVNSVLLLTGMFF
jgi:lipid A 3-O-deacylase